MGTQDLAIIKGHYPALVSVPYPNPESLKMSPKHILVLLLALVFATISLVADPLFAAPHNGPTEEASLQEQENSQLNSGPFPLKPHHREQDNSQVNNYPHKPPHPHGPPHNPTTELSQEEKENSELNAYPHRHKKHPPKEDNSQVNAYPNPHKPPHEPPHKPTTEELSHEVNNNPREHRKRPPPKEDNSHSGAYRHVPRRPHGPPHKQSTEELPLQQQKNVIKEHPYPGHGHPHVVEEDQKKEVDNTPRHRPPHHPPTAN